MKSRDLLVLMAVVFITCTSASGQQVRYMDSSGNIHFVDNINQVPPRYRQQVETPTPVPVLDRKALAEKKRQEQLAKREKMEQEKEKRRADRDRKYEEQQRKKEEAKKNRRKGQASGFGRLS